MNLLNSLGSAMGGGQSPSLAGTLPSLVDTRSPGGTLPGGDLVDLAKSALSGGELGKLLG